VAAGVGDGAIRLSIGRETTKGLIRDLKRASGTDEGGAL
jgi:cystathionine beta-lyase/cystathionine gamma-synthase